jgi:hypothetical protein
MPLESLDNEASFPKDPTDPTHDEVPMQLNEEQKHKVAEWISEGLNLSEIQDKMGTQWNIRMTYMEARMLIGDLQLLPKDPIVPVGEKATEQEGSEIPLTEEPAADGGTGTVSVTTDTLARPGAMISGRVTFSDGQTGMWHLDQFGRFSLIPPVPGYKPSEEDIQKIQPLLDRELAKAGF